ncbi:hypothetical protein BU14_0254s0017 [Porphyra umbilicalis]|uniref:RPA43 OB domain-containing protein n=1 Tax=Porphyra umbilicalis TaxID=2786 RepID=A0A1X6P2U7_PORUM|nr:hypothetical protein BU14_0254s0017 [Porphyra umbilicalis]|eukprot:OSX75137.1 hypothetical protein BU14_0254s0017 [Porphyra umbilicalis]
MELDDPPPPPPPPPPSGAPSTRRWWWRSRPPPWPAAAPPLPPPPPPRRSSRRCCATCPPCGASLSRRSPARGAGAGGGGGVHGRGPRGAPPRLLCLRARAGRVLLLVFSPPPDALLRGIVRFVAADHIGVSVLRVFHAVIALADAPATYTPNVGAATWTPSAEADGDAGAASPITAGTAVRFAVLDTRHTPAGLFHIRGSLSAPGAEVLADGDEDGDGGMGWEGAAADGGPDGLEGGGGGCKTPTRRLRPRWGARGGWGGGRRPRRAATTDRGGGGGGGRVGRGRQRRQRRGGVRQRRQQRRRRGRGGGRGARARGRRRRVGGVGGRARRARRRRRTVGTALAGFPSERALGAARADFSR